MPKDKNKNTKQIVIKDSKEIKVEILLFINYKWMSSFYVSSSTQQ